MTSAMPAPSAASASASAVVVAPAAIPFKPADGEAVGGVGLPAAAFACLVLLAVAVAALRRWGPRAGRLGADASVVEIIERRRLADRMRLCVIRYRGRELLVAHSDQVATVLADEAVAGAGRAS